MKIMHLLLMLACLQSARGQGTAKTTDFCAQIKKEVSDDKITFMYSSPYDPFDKTPMRITRNYSFDKENPYDNFNIIFQVFSDIDDIYTVSPTGEKVEKQEKNTVIEFEDKSKITDDTTAINHDFSEDKTQSLRYVYFPVNDQNIKDFTSKRIVKITLGGHETVVRYDSTNSFQKWLQCMKAVK